MENKSKEKTCICESPLIRDSIPEGFRGKIVCAECGGIAELPRSDKRYDGDDQVKAYLFEVSKNRSSLTAETASLIMMIRIEEKMDRLLSALEKDNAQQTSKPAETQAKK